eukprot:CAMPEP_0206528258 /NCGR_PEP_ID=MMETSP0325_2-20121206/1858_1 /ASSEMBLY_ACC=CAM_ASM_000347 /TAXON_ID=2866 /ORGANISM="Crypthecodinium cohnii, Strain Seligo" /LENGTH=651 /DNA_ID=CAMNT_0054023867 /DNA_START=75 /DNA_END=2029 /DNA_ORIENTATION=+
MTFETSRSFRSKASNSPRHRSQPSSQQFPLPASRGLESGEEELRLPHRLQRHHHHRQQRGCGPQLLPSFGPPPLPFMLLLLPACLLLLLVLPTPTSAFEDVDEPEDGLVRILPLHGDINANGHKSVELQIGNPPQRVHLVLSLEDEGLIVPCNCDQVCEARWEHYGPYNPKMSTTSEAVGTDEVGVKMVIADTRGPAKNAARKPEKKIDRVFGEWMRDHVSIPDLIPTDAPGQVIEFPCDEQRSFKPGFSGRWNGIFGLHPSNNLLQKLLPSSQETSEAKPGHPGNKKKDKKVKSAVSTASAGPAPFFSLCFAPEGGLLTLNGFNEQRHSSPMVGLPLLKDSGGVNYTVRLASVHVGSKKLQASKASKASKVPEHRATVKVGSPFSSFPAKLYEHFVKALEEACASEKRCQAQRLGASCWKLPFPADPVRHFPRLILHMGGSNSRVEWLAIIEGSGSEVILGDSWLLNREVVFDSWQEQLWVAPANCSSPPPKPPTTETTTSTTAAPMNPFSWRGKFDKFGLSSGFLPEPPGRGPQRPPGLGLTQGNATKTGTPNRSKSKLFPTGAFSVAISLASFMCIWSCATPRVRQVVGQQRRRIGFDSDFLDELFGRELGPVPEDPGDALQPPRPPRRSVTPLTTARNEESAAEEQE